MTSDSIPSYTTTATNTINTNLLLCGVCPVSADHIHSSADVQMYHVGEELERERESNRRLSRRLIAAEFHNVESVVDRMLDRIEYMEMKNEKEEAEKTVKLMAVRINSYLNS
ncbi:unnamed protein product [Rotaria sp. Silwood1]|nr:unnamed protein product [Rotaria sp. Silwood1]CAF1681822.1 unnamed protein product [Rotaria sp. Silwood1]